MPFPTPSHDNWDWVICLNFLRPLPDKVSSPFSNSHSETASRLHQGGAAGGKGRDRNEGESRRLHALPPEFVDASPATCTQAYVDNAFGYYRPGGEVGLPLPLPVQVRREERNQSKLDIHG